MKLAKTESEIPAACKRGGCERSVDRGADFFPAKTPILYVGCFYVVARCAPTEIAVRRHSRAHGRAASAKDWKPGKGGAISSFARIEDNYRSSGLAGSAGCFRPDDMLSMSIFS